MKTIRKDELIKRVSDDAAKFRVENQGWIYITKEEWKRSVRDAVKIEKEKKKTEYDEQEKKSLVDKPRAPRVTNQSKKKANKKKR